MMNNRLALVLTLLIAAYACTAGPIAFERSSTVRVELDAYSGRPNPRWTLTADEVAQLRRKLTDLPAAPAAPTAPGLGYRGFHLREGKDTNARITVFGGTILMVATGAIFRDVHGLESWLQALARAKGFAAGFDGPAPARPM